MKTTHRRKTRRHSNATAGKKMTSNEPLSIELAWFEANRLELFEKYPGRWVAVKGEELLGVYDDFSTAFTKGSKKANSPQILVKQILLKDVTFSAPALTLGLISARL